MKATAVWDKIKLDEKHMKKHPFQPMCHTNVIRMNFEKIQYCNSIIDQFLPKTSYRQSLPIRYSSNSSFPLKCLQTQREQYEAIPTSHRKQNGMELKKALLEEAERDKKTEKLLFEQKYHLSIQRDQIFDKTATIPEKL